MWEGGGRVFLHFLDYLFYYVLETNLHFIYYIPEISGPLTTSGIVLFVALFNDFRPWTNVRKIYILDVVGILE